MNEGLIIKRAHYCYSPKTKKRNRRIKTTSDLVGLLRYFEQQDHENHEDIKLREVRYWSTSKDAIVGAIADAAVGYREASICRAGNHWSEDIAEHLIVAPDEGAFFTSTEELLIERRVAEILCPDSPCATVRHVNLKTGRMEMHVAASAFTRDFPPRLRVSELRRRYGADYLMLLHECGERILAEINDARDLKNETPVRTLGTIRVTHLKNLVGVLFDEAFLSSRPVETIDDVLGLLRGTQWLVVKKSKTRVALQPPYAEEPIWLLWEDILSWSRHELAFMTRERDKARLRDDQVHQPDRERASPTQEP